MNRSGQPSPGGAIRPLGLLERTFWNLDRERPVHFAVAAEVAGVPDRADWAHATRAAVRRQPLLAGSIRAGEDGVPSFHPGDAPVPLRVLDGTEWEAEAARELATPFVSDRSPLVRVAVVAHGNRAVVIVVSHHAVADGLAGVYVLRDILRSLAGEDLVPLPPPACQEVLMGWAPGRSAGPPGMIPRPVTYREPKGGPPVVRGLRLDRGLTRDLRDRCRREGTTVHAALNVAVLSWVARMAPGRLATPVRVFTPINLRPQLGLIDECVVALGAGIVTGGATPPGLFWDEARRVRAELSEARTLAAVSTIEDAMGGLHATGPSSRQVAEFGAVAFAYEVMITNLGAEPIGTSFGPLRVEAVWGPAVLLGYRGEQTIGVATADGVLRLLHTSHDPIPGLLDGIQEALVEALG